MQDEYRSMQDGLLAWLRAIEREKLALNLRHVRVGSGGVERALKKVEVRSNRNASRNICNQGSAKRWSPGLVNFVTALAYATSA